MAVAVPAPARGMGVRAFGRRWHTAALVVVALLVVGAAGVAGWTLRGTQGESLAAAGARYEKMTAPVNERCSGSMAPPTADSLAVGPCRPALEMFAAAVRNGVWPDAVKDEAARLAAAADVHAGWLARLDAAQTPDAHRAVLGEILAQRPLPYAATMEAARAFRDALGLVGGPEPLV